MLLLTGIRNGYCCILLPHIRPESKFFRLKLRFVHTLQGLQMCQWCDVLAGSSAPISPIQNLFSQNQLEIASTGKKMVVLEVMKCYHSLCQIMFFTEWHMEQSQFENMQQLSLKWSWTKGTLALIKGYQMDLRPFISHKPSDGSSANFWKQGPYMRSLVQQRCTQLDRICGP